MKENLLIDKSVAFASRIIKLHQYLIKTKKKRSFPSKLFVVVRVLGRARYDTMKLAQTQSYAGFFRHATRATASACGWHLGGRLFVSPIITQIGRENNISAEICL